MEFDKESILSKTHYGITIYAYILRQYYPGETVLSLSGRDCKPTKNPFNEDKVSLVIKIVDGCAIFLDSLNDLLCGDPFDFAELHYKLKGNKLLQKINEDMKLRLDISDSFYLDRPEPQGLFWEGREEFEPPVFSYFSKPVSNIYPKRKIDLVDLYSEIKGSRFIDCTSRLRKIKDPKEARKFKANNFDYVTFSGTFSRRTDKELIDHSGLLTIDFDHISDVQQLRKKLLNDEYFETELILPHLPVMG